MHNAQPTAIQYIVLLRSFDNQVWAVPSVWPGLVPRSRCNAGLCMTGCFKKQPIMRLQWRDTVQAGWYLGWTLDHDDGAIFLKFNISILLMTNIRKVKWLGLVIINCQTVSCGWRIYCFQCPCCQGYKYYSCEYCCIIALDQSVCLFSHVTDFGCALLKGTLSAIVASLWERVAGQNTGTALECHCNLVQRVAWVLRPESRTDWLDYGTW